MTEAVVVNQPPSKKVLVDANSLERQRIYAQAWLEQTSQVAACNERLYAIRQWVKEQEKLIEQSEKDTDFEWCVNC